ncbi:hypothetical protein D3C77_675370 [compost metagenome]
MPCARGGFAPFQGAKASLRSTNVDVYLLWLIHLSVPVRMLGILFLAKAMFLVSWQGCRCRMLLYARPAGKGK